MEQNQNPQPKRKLIFPIFAQLVLLTLILLLSSAGLITFGNVDAFESTSKLREEDANRDQASARATEVERLLMHYIDKIKITGALLYKEYRDPREKQSSLDLTFRQDREFVSIEIVKSGQGAPIVHERVTNREYLDQYKLPEDYISMLRQTNPFPVASVFAGEVEIRNTSIVQGAPLITIGIPFVKDAFGKITHILIADMRLDSLQKVFANVRDRVMYLVDGEGRAMAHPNEKWALAAQNLGQTPIVRRALDAQFRQGQMEFTDPGDGDVYVGAFSRTSLGPIVIAQASKDVILEPARVMKRSSIYTAGIILWVALFFILIFSIKLTAPIERLAEVTRRVAQGDFSIRSNVKALNEVGELGRSFDAMVGGLEEREKMRNVLNKFHGSSITDDLLSGDLNLGGTRKHVTVFFSDIRDFTKFSEGHKPEEVVDMLNEYFHEMVSIINRYGGVVDKFIGDAIMAVWGAPRRAGNEELMATRACLEMRRALEVLNETRMGRGQVPIKIGMALHTGEAISGTIGSSERMEYTVIGDTVNMASRIEASTKAFGTDLLISEETAELVKERFRIELAGSAEVKGKSKPLKMFKVRAYQDEESGEWVELRTAYSDYEAGDADKVKVA